MVDTILVLFESLYPAARAAGKRDETFFEVDHALDKGSGTGSHAAVARRKTSHDLAT
jgi:hypothetical protein